MRIERECFTGEAYTKEQTLSLLRSPNAISLLARVNGEVAGFIIGMVEGISKVKAGHLYTIDVAVKHRRKSIGIKLLNKLEEHFMKSGAQISYLEVRVDNHAARRLYHKQGYVNVEPLTDYYSAGVRGLRLKKELEPKQKFSSEL